MLEPEFRKPLLNGEIRRRGIYLLPNIFTTAALFAGFYAIVMAMNQRFDNAAVAIFIAMILDTLDGRVARLTRTQSAFGAEYDSLSDMVCFGAAPALCIYEWALKELGRCAASRALQHQHQRGRQALLPGAAQSRRGRARGRVPLAGERQQDSGERLRPAVGGGVHHALRRALDGEQRAVLQLQDDQSAAVGALHRHLPHRPRLRADLVRPADRAVPAVRGVRPVGVRLLDLEEARRGKTAPPVAVTVQTGYIPRVHPSRTSLKPQLGSLLLAGLLLRLAR